jgi:hypothetical protein
LRLLEIIAGYWFGKWQNLVKKVIGIRLKMVRQIAQRYCRRAMGLYANGVRPCISLKSLDAFRHNHAAKGNQDFGLESFKSFP